MTDCVQVPYKIHSYSSFSSTYRPEYVQAYDPLNAKSRWSANSGNGDQFLLLEIPYPYVPQRLIFGKFKEKHVCNLKEFVVEGGPTPDSMVPLIHGGLRNDTSNEYFPLLPLPRRPPVALRYLRIIPLAAHGVNYNYSIWYLELQGVCDPALYSKTFSEAALARTRMLADAIQLGVHLLEGNTALPSKLSPPMRLCSSFVNALMASDYDKCRTIINALDSEGWLTELFLSEPPSLYFNRVETSGPYPGPRGGHQLVGDGKGNLWLFGGFDGNADLDELWRFNSTTCQWEDIQRSTPWPPACSCHRMVYSARSNSLIVLGPCQTQSRDELPPLWIFSCTQRRWEEIRPSRPWPAARYDHQMVVVDEGDEEVLYVLGGSPCSDDGGIWRLSLNERKFSRIGTQHIVVANGECNPSFPAGNGATYNALVPFDRTTCMAVASNLLSFQMKMTMVIDLRTNTRWPVLGNNALAPPIASTLRCVLLPNGSILAYSGIQYTLRPTNQLWDAESNSVWWFDTHKYIWRRLCVVGPEINGIRGFVTPESGAHDTGTESTRRTSPEASFYKSIVASLAPSTEWITELIIKCALMNERRALAVPEDPGDLGEAPQPRFAHQLALADPANAYLFGGNPNVPGETGNERLNDLWHIRLAYVQPRWVARCFEYLLARVESIEKGLSVSGIDDKATFVAAQVVRIRALVSGLLAFSSDAVTLVRALLTSPQNVLHELVAKELPLEGAPDVVLLLKQQLVALVCGAIGINTSI